MANVHDEAVTRLDSAVSEVFETMLARTDGKALKVEAGIEPLLRIAADLRSEFS